MELCRVVMGAELNMGTLVTDVLFAACVVALLGELAPGARGLARTLAEFAGVYLAENLIGLALLATGASDAQGAPSFPALFGAMAAYALLQRRLSATDRVVRCATFAASFVIAVGLTTILISVFTPLKAVSWGKAVPSAVSYVAMAVFALVLRRYSVEGFAYVPRNYVGLVVSLDALGAISAESFVVLAVPYTVGYPSANPLADPTNFTQAVLLINAIVDAGFLVLTLIAYLMFYLLAREHDSRAGLLIAQKSDADTMNQILVTRSMYDSIRAARHELKNNNAYMASLLEKGDYDGLKAYFAAYDTELAGVLDYVSSGNRAVDAVVNAKMSLARSRGIEVKTMLAVPDSMGIAEDDLFRLLANLLDNAIEGTLASARPQGPVRLRIVPQGGYFYIGVSNPCDPASLRRDRSGSLLTSKEGGGIHGFGTKVVEAIAEKYQGSASFTAEGDEFCASVLVAPRRAAREEG